jgi:hypothetical protein
MGKRRKRLTMAKYAKKYASIRNTIAKLKNTPDTNTTTTTEPVLSVEPESIESVLYNRDVTTIQPAAEQAPEPIIEKEVEPVTEVVKKKPIVATKTNNVATKKRPVKGKFARKKPVRTTK